MILIGKGQGGKVNISQDFQSEASTTLLKNAVLETTQKYFDGVGDSEQSKLLNVYDMVLGEVEKPLLEVVMKHTKGNQSNAAKALGLSRGTLRKKLKIYGMLK